MLLCLPFFEASRAVHVFWSEEIKPNILWLTSLVLHTSISISEGKESTECMLEQVSGIYRMRIWLLDVLEKLSSILSLSLPLPLHTLESLHARLRLIKLDTTLQWLGQRRQSQEIIVFTKIPFGINLHANQVVVRKATINLYFIEQPSSSC